MRRYPIIEIEDVSEPFCGKRRKSMVPLFDAEPEIAAQWVYAKNCGWGPEHFSRASGVRCWWECPDCSRQYKAQISNRTSKAQSACPYCASKKVCSDNSLVDICPDVAAQWHPTKNRKLRPDQVMYASGKKAWWLCSTCCHSWQCVIADRTGLQSGCPACYESRMEYAREHPTRTIKPQVVLGKAKASRDWYDSGRSFIPLSKSDPKIARQWHPTKNGDLRPSEIAKGSDAIAWWKCKNADDHEWQAAVYSRTGNRSRGCPFCHNFRVAESNSLATNYPELASEWHLKRNGKLTASDIAAGGKKKHWWKCLNQPKHEWETSIYARINGSGCPYCTHKKVSTLNSLAKLYPKIAAQLHQTLNGDLKAKDIAAKSSKKLWWRCKVASDHIWQATVGNRTERGSGCPACAGKVASSTNSLATLFPKVAKLWDKKKNAPLKPQEVTAGSSKEVWWCCRRGHNWKQSIRDRATAVGSCRYCD